MQIIIAPIITTTFSYGDSGHYIGFWQFVYLQFSRVRIDCGTGQEIFMSDISWSDHRIVLISL